MPRQQQRQTVGEHTLVRTSHSVFTCEDCGAKVAEGFENHLRGSIECETHA